MNRLINSARLSLIALATAAAPAAAFAQSSIGSVNSSAETKLEASIADLSALRASISEQKVPLATQLRELEAQVSEKREEQMRLQRQKDNSGVELGSLQAQLSARQDEIAYISNLLLDYVNRLNASLDPSEVQLQGDALLEILNTTEGADVSKDQLLAARQSAVDMGIERLAENAGGRLFPGKAVLPDGSYVEGSFALIGPLALFASEDGKSAGLAQRGSSTEPRLLVFDNAAIGPISSLIAKGSGDIPIDTSGGRATAISATKESLIEHIGKGGIWMYPILAFAFVALAVGAFKLLELSKYKLLPKGIVYEVLDKLRAGDRAGAEQVAKSHSGAESEMLVKGIKNVHMPKELLDEVLFETLLEEKPKLERGLSFITVTAAVAPLLGLLGTVTGMINTFKAITLFGTGDAKSLSSGISEALITTEWGLIVAIPALLLGSYLSRKANGMLSRMEKTSITFVNGVSANAASNLYEFEERRRVSGGAKA